MSILSLPTELLFAIAEQECVTRKDHCSLIRVNKAFFAIFAQILYRDILIKLPLHAPVLECSLESSKFAVGDPILQAVLERLDNNPHLRACVRKCRIENLVCQHRYYPPPQEKPHPESVLDPLFTLIGQFIHLDSIYFSNTYIPIKWMLYLARHSKLRLSIELSHADTYNEAEVETLPGGSFSATALTSHEVSLDYFARSLAFGDSLVHLRLPKLSLGTVTAAHESSGKPVLESLRSLVIGNFVDNGFLFLAYSPNLLRLEFLDDLTPISDPRYAEDWNRVLPRLETIICHYVLLLYFTSHRSVTSIFVNYGIPYNPTPLPRYFGSNVPIRRLYVGCCANVGQFLSYLVDHNTEIEELAIIYQTFNRRSCEFNILHSFFLKYQV